MLVLPHAVTALVLRAGASLYIEQEYRKGGSFRMEGGFRTLPIIAPPQTQEGHVLL